MAMKCKLAGLLLLLEASGFYCFWSLSMFHMCIVPNMLTGTQSAVEHLCSAEVMASLFSRQAS